MNVSFLTTFMMFRDELVEAYGYDIRGEDNAPRARRRRRYGRGPNKYTRNWEDEDAYGKPVSAPRGGRGGGQQRTTDKAGNDVIIEDFPALPSRDKEVQKKEIIEPLMKRDVPRNSTDREVQRNSMERDVPRNSMEREENLRNNRNDRRGRGRGRDGGGRDEGGFRGSRGRGGPRGGYDQHPPRRGGGGGDRGFGRGGYEDRKRYNDRFPDRKEERNFDENWRGGGGGGNRGGRGRGRGRGADNGDLKNKRYVQNQDIRREELIEDMGNMSMNKEPADSNGNVPRSGGKRYSSQRRGGGEHINTEQQNLREMYNEGLNPAMCSGPPSGPPFQRPMATTRLPHNTVVSNSGGRPVPASFIQNPPLMNYGPGLVAGPPVSLPIPLTAIPQLQGNVSTPILAPGTESILIYVISTCRAYFFSKSSLLGKL